MPKRKASLTKTRVVTRRQRMASNVRPDDTSELERIITARVTDSLADVIKLSVQQALSNHLPSYQLPVASTSGVEGQEPRPCLVDTALGIVETEGQEPQPSGIHANLSTSVASSIALDAVIPDSIKQKIWANEYVDLVQLLKPSDWGQYSLALTTGTGAPALCLQPKRKTTIVSIDQWCSAFNIFMTIFLTKFQTQAQSILQYCETVRRIEKAGGDFVSFDENVRIQRQNNPTAWDTFNAEQYVVAMTHSNKSPSSNFTPAHKVPRGFCFAFHAGRFCPGCQHSHMCPGCGGSHPSSKCQAAREHIHAPHFPQQQQMRGNSDAFHSQSFRSTFQFPTPSYKPRFQAAQGNPFSFRRPRYTSRYALANRVSPFSQSSSTRMGSPNTHQH